VSGSQNLARMVGDLANRALRGSYPAFLSNFSPNATLTVPRKHLSRKVSVNRLKRDRYGFCVTEKALSPFSPRWGFANRQDVKA
jgi:hypothetical protein